MPYVMIEHKVANYAKWKRGVKAFAKHRKASGEKCFYACRGSKNPNDILVWCEWSTTAKLKKFMNSKELKAAMKNAGVVGKPTVSIWNGLEVLSVK